jgi:hypothetical protein
MGLCKNCRYDSAHGERHLVTKLHTERVDDRNAHEHLHGAFGPGMCLYTTHCSVNALRMAM